MRKRDRYCVKCFLDLEDTDVRCRHCGQDYVKLHIRITAIHKKDSHNFKDRKLWIGKTGEFIIDTDYTSVKNSDIGTGWYGGYFIPDESPSETWLQNAIQFIEVQQPALTVVPLLNDYFYGQVELLRQVLSSFFSQDDGGQPQSASGLVALHDEDLVAAFGRLQTKVYSYRIVTFETVYLRLLKKWICSY